MALSRDDQRMFPALGAGKLGNDVNQLIQAPEEEEDFDVLNDETFGDLGDANYDWEDEHKRMAEELESSSFFDTPLEENQTKDSGFVTMDRGLSMLSSTTQEDDLERSIRRLVVDDNDNTKAFTLFGQPIPGAQRQSHLDELFGPNSPPGYMDMEALPSPQGKNIWGSPSGDSSFQKPVNNTLQALFASAKQAALRDFPTTIFHDSRSAGIHPPSLPTEAPTLAEIEHNMMAREHQNQKPRVLTAAELERQLRGDPPLPGDKKPQFAGPGAQIPPVGAAVAFRNQPTQGPHPQMASLGQRVPNGESSPINIVRPRGQGFPVYQGQESPATMGRSPSPSPSQVPPGMPAPPPPQHFMAQSPRLMSPYNPAQVMMANRILGNPMVRPSPPPTHMPPPGVGSPFGSPYGSPSPAVVMASRVPQGPSVFDQQSPPNRPGTGYPPGRPYGSHQMHPHHSSRNSHSGERNMDPRNSNNMNYSNHGNQHFVERRDYNDRGGYNQRRHDQGVADSSDRDSEDPYAGLMTKKEKDWIIKIQLIQLQTDNPYLDDYYYTYHTMRKKAADRDRQQMESSVDGNNKEPELIIPSMVKLEPRTYTPAQFEGSLGRLTAASVHNPRQIIDVCRNKSPTNEELAKKNVSKELRRYRQLLMDIEKGFNNILDVDDIEKKILALPHENRLPLFEERREKIQTVYSYFMQDENLKFKNFVPAMAVRKGRKLLARLMSLLDKIQSLDIVTVLLSHLPMLIKRDDDDKEGLLVLMPQVSRHMGHCDLEFLVHYATILQEHNEEGIAMLLHSSFGISLLCCMIKAGEDYFKKTSPVDIDNQMETKWSHFIGQFVESLQGVPVDQLARPTHQQPAVGDHVDRFINNKLLGAVEDKLAHIVKPRPTPQQQQQQQQQHGENGKVLNKPIPAAS